jgi:hypothetical protein
LIAKLLMPRSESDRHCDLKSNVNAELAESR